MRKSKFGAIHEREREREHGREKEKMTAADTIKYPNHAHPSPSKYPSSLLPSPLAPLTLHSSPRSASPTPLLLAHSPRNSPISLPSSEYRSSMQGNGDLLSACSVAHTPDSLMGGMLWAVSQAGVGLPVWVWCSVLLLVGGMVS